MFPGRTLLIWKGCQSTSIEKPTIFACPVEQATVLATVRARRP
jgi:hypothetical protein